MRRGSRSRLPLLGALFRGSSSQDQDKRLYIFVKAEIIRPAETRGGLEDLRRLSDRDRAAFEAQERRFQDFRSCPGRSTAVDPARVLDAR